MTTEVQFRIQKRDQRTMRLERVRVLRALRALLPFAYVVEIGSTAVPGVIGKEDLDFMVRVPLRAFPLARATLDEWYSRDPKQLANMSYQGYTVESPLDLSIQLVVEGSEYDRFVDFLEVLRKSDDARRRYNELKKEWDGKPMQPYRMAKEVFIKKVLDERD